MAEARFTRSAMRDLDDIAVYIAEESGEPEIGRRFIRRIFDVANHYATQPEAGAPQDQYKKGARCFLVGQYIAYYRKRRWGVTVIRIRHGTRKPPRSR